jgi:GNAT superfamily N-acetyltransferase
MRGMMRTLLGCPTESAEVSAMVSNHTVSIEDHPSKEDVHALQVSLGRYNDLQAAPHNWRALAVFMRDSQGEIVAGLAGSTEWEWLFIDTLFVSEPLRHQRHGRQLMSHAEGEASRRGCLHAHLNTFDFEGPPFL